MHREFLPICVLGLLAGCAGFGSATSLDDVPRLDEVAVSDEAVAMAAPQEAPGIFGRFFNRDAPASEQTPVEEAGASAEAPGLFQRMLGGGNEDGSAIDGDAAEDAAGTVPPLTNQPFGVVSKTCGVGRGDLGTKIAGVSGYTVYDTFPNSTAPRPHYITGFDDGCARQFTAALVLVGDVGTHEVVRYETAQARRPYTQVDNAYEAIKSRFCRTGFGKPCGGRIDALARSTTFVTGYERFTSSPVWVEILLHAGSVAAVGVENE